MTFVANKLRAFKEDADPPELVSKRSEGRIKSYVSATDTRCWTDDGEDRRQHILDIIKASQIKAGTLGKYVPIEVLIDTLLANKNADIERLKIKIDELQRLLDMYEQILTEDQKKQIEAMKAGISLAGVRLETMSSQEEKDSSDWPDICNCDVEIETIEPSDYTKIDKPCTAKMQLDECKMTLMEKDAKIISLKSVLEGQKIEYVELKNRKDETARKMEKMKEQLSNYHKMQADNNNLTRKLARIREIVGKIFGESVSDAEELEDRLIKLQAFMHHRDKLITRVEELEEQLQHHQDLVEELEVMRRRTKLLDDIMEERNNLMNRLKQLEDLDREVRELKHKADLVDGLEGQIKQLNNENEELKGELGRYKERPRAEVVEKLKDEVGRLQKELVKYQNRPEEGKVKEMEDSLRSELERAKAELWRASELQTALSNLQTEMARVQGSSDAEIATLKAEKERLTNQLYHSEGDNQRLKLKATEFDLLQLERDKLKLRLEELGAIQLEYEHLLCKLRCLEATRAERDTYKSKYEQLLDFECECERLRSQVEVYQSLDKERDCAIRKIKEYECCICDQETEIKKLRQHVAGYDQQCECMEKVFYKIQTELDQKNQMLALSDKQLASLQDQLQNTLTEGSCETKSLRTHIKQLESNLQLLNSNLKNKQDEIDYKDQNCSQLQDQCQNLQERCQKLNSLNRHLQERVEGHQEAIQNCESEAKNASSELDFERHQKEKLENQIWELKQVIEQRKRETEEAKQLIKKLRSRLEDTDRLIQENATLRKQLLDMQSVAKVDTSPRKTCNCTELVGIQTEKERLESFIADLQTNLQKEIEKRENVEQDLKQAERSIVELEENLKEAESKDDFRKLEEDNDRLRHDIGLLKNENEMLIRRPNELQVEINSLKQEVFACRQDSEQMGKLNSLLAAKEKELATLRLKLEQERLRCQTDDPLAKLQALHEEVLKDIKSDHDKELEGLREELCQRNLMLCKLQKESDYSSSCATKELSSYYDESNKHQMNRYCKPMKLQEDAFCKAVGKKCGTNRLGKDTTNKQKHGQEHVTKVPIKQLDNLKTALDEERRINKELIARFHDVHLAKDTKFEEKGAMGFWLKEDQNNKGSERIVEIDRGHGSRLPPVLLLDNSQKQTPSQDFKRNGALQVSSSRFDVPTKPQSTLLNIERTPKGTQRQQDCIHHCQSSQTKYERSE